MLKYSEIENTFNAIGITISEFNLETDDNIELPYVVYTANDSESFGADGINYIRLLNMTIAFFDETMNLQLQRKIESVFDENEVRFQKSINFDDDARIYAVSYTITVMDDGNN